MPPALLQALEEELHGRQRQVSSLQEISSQLLLEATAEDSVEAKEKVHVIGNKLRLLLRQVANDLHILQGRLVRQHWVIYLCNIRTPSFIFFVNRVYVLWYSH